MSYFLSEIWRSTLDGTCRDFLVFDIRSPKWRNIKILCSREYTFRMNCLSNCIIICENLVPVHTWRPSATRQISQNLLFHVILHEMFHSIISSFENQSSSWIWLFWTISEICKFAALTQLKWKFIEISQTERENSPVLIYLDNVKQRKFSIISEKSDFPDKNKFSHFISRMIVNGFYRSSNRRRSKMEISREIFNSSQNIHENIS